MHTAFELFATAVQAHLLRIVWTIVRKLTAECAVIHQAAAEVVVGDPLAPGTQMGPIVSLAQMEKVKAVVDHAKFQGATVIAPELRLQSELARGYYVP